MAAKGRFYIPSAKEMEEVPEKEVMVTSLFDTHRSSKTNATKPAVNASSSSCKTDKHIERNSLASNDPKQLVTPETAAAATVTISEAHCPATVISTAASGQISSTSEISSSEAGGVIGKYGKSNSLIVSTRQRGNPILKHVRNVPWEFGDIVPDYVMGKASCALFLSLRYHALNPNYVQERFKQLGHSYDLRVLLIQVDTKDPKFALKQLAKICILTDCTLILAWTAEEAGRYLETYKSFEVKPPDLIMEKTESNYMSQLTDTLTAVKKVNKTDAMTLLTAFGSLQKIVQGTEEDLSLCPGFGPQKAKRLYNVFHEPFVKSKRPRSITTVQQVASTSSKDITTSSPMKQKVNASPRKKLDLLS